jgi:hypothetical protein
MQVHSESVQFISITSNIINTNIYSNPELREWLPEKEKLSKLYQAGSLQFYLYGREWLSKTLKSSSMTNIDHHHQNSVDKSEIILLEAQLLEYAFYYVIFIIIY